MNPTDTSKDSKKQSIKIGKYLIQQYPNSSSVVEISIINDGEGGVFNDDIIEQIIDNAWSDIF